MHDADTRGDGAKVIEGSLGPMQQLVAFAIARKFEIDINLQCIGRGEAIDLHAVIDHQIGGNQRIDFVGVPAEPLHRAPHGRQIDHGRYASEILQHNPRGQKGNFDRCAFG